jgi:hypothetical protein
LYTTGGLHHAAWSSRTVRGEDRCKDEMLIGGAWTMPLSAGRLTLIMQVVAYFGSATHIRCLTLD